MYSVNNDDRIDLEAQQPYSHNPYATANSTLVTDWE
jgi:hypothetical protein